jgi:hypothetical protein
VTPRREVPVAWSRRVEPRRRLLITALLGGVLVLDALYYAFCLAQTAPRVSRPGAALVPDFWLWSFMRDAPLPIPGSPAGVAVAVVVSTVVGFATYGVIVWLHWDRPGRRAAWLVGGIAATTFAISAVAMPTTNSDVYDYILFGRVAAVHGEDPHVTFPDEFADDPIYPYSSHQYTGRPDNKLPAWTLLTVGLARFGGDSPVTNVLLYRSALAALNLGSLALVALIVRRVRPQSVVAALAIFGLNPIVALLGPSKTDSLMAFFLLGTAALLVLGRRRWAVVSLAVSMFVKLITVPLAAVFWLRELRLRRYAALATDAVIVAVTVALLYAPFSRGLDLLTDHLSLLGGGGDTISGPLRSVSIAAFVLVLAAVGLTRDESHLSLFRGWAVVALGFGVLLSRPTLSWYLIVPVAAVAIACEWRTAAALVPVTAGSFLMSTWQLLDARRYDLPARPAVIALAVFAVLGGAILLAYRLRSGRRVPRAEEPHPESNGRTPVTAVRSA